MLPRDSRPPRAGEPNVSTLTARGARVPTVGQEQTRPSRDPLYQTAVFEFDSIAACERALGGEGHAYVRNGLPNAQILERSLARVEGAQACLVTASGMTAIYAALLAATNAGDRILCQRDVYGGTRALFDHDAARLGLTVEYIDAYEPSKVADGLDRGARFVFVESLSNPLLREVDIAALSWHARACGAVLCVDNTLATAAFKRPLDLGANLVVHSLTKFVGGHHDLCAGALLGSDELVALARASAVRVGLGASPMDAWLAERGLRTLALRMQRSHTTARQLAPKLAEHAAVRQVFYPGWGALLSFDVGSREAADRTIARCPTIPLAPSLGGTESTFSHPATTSHRTLSPEERSRLGIGEGLLRLSVGLEEPVDLWEELARALS